MDDLLKDNSVVTIYLDLDDPDEGGAVAKADKSSIVIDDVVTDVPMRSSEQVSEQALEQPSGRSFEQILEQAPDKKDDELPEKEPEEKEPEAPVVGSGMTSEGHLDIPEETPLDRAFVDGSTGEAVAGIAEGANGEVVGVDDTSADAHVDAQDDEAVNEADDKAVDETDGADAARNPVPVVNPRRTPRVNPVDPSSETDKYGIYQDAVSSSNTLGIGLVLLLCAIALIVAMWIGLGFVADQAKEQGAQTLRDTILDTAMQCFAIEGYYPPSLEYLQENYGLSVNEDDYMVVYVAFASNVPPTVDVRMR